MFLDVWLMSVSDDKSKSRPTVSIVIPARNEEQHIAACLQAILRQDYPADKLEVIVVDGCSTDATAQIARHILSSQTGIVWRVMENPERMTPVALNRGIEAATGDVIIRVDGHCDVATDYVSKCVEVQRRTGAGCVGGHMRPLAHGYVGQAIAASHSSRFGLGGGKFHDPSFEGEVDTVYMGCWPRSVFTEIGLFDESLCRNQDIEFNARIRRHGDRVYLSPSIKSTYHCRSSFVSLVKQNLANGLWNVYTVLRSPGSLSLRHFVPLVFILALLLLGGLSYLLPAARVGLLAVLGLYAAATLTASVACALRYGLRLLPIMPIVFAALHLSYGAGSLWGVIKFLILRMKPGPMTKALQAGATTPGYTA